MPSGISLTYQQQDTIRALAAGGKRAYQIAEAMGLPRQTVQNFFQRNGLCPPDARFGPRKQRPQQAPKPEPVPYVPWPQIDPTKEWPIGCFKGQDVSEATLAREAAGRGRPLVGAPSITLNRTTGGVATYGA